MYLRKHLDDTRRTLIPGSIPNLNLSGINIQPSTLIIQMYIHICTYIYQGWDTLKTMDMFLATMECLKWPLIKMCVGGNNLVEK